MQTIYRAALTVAAIVLLLPVSGQAEIKAGSFEVSPFVGYSLFENDQNLDDAPVFGGRLGYNFTKHFGIEAVGEYISTEVDDQSITGAREGQYRGPTDDVDLTFYHLDAVYHFMPDGRFNPFVVVGLGGAHYSPDISDADMGVINVGVGAKYWLKDNIALRVDVRDTMVTEFFQETYHNLGATVGVVFAFGGKEKPVAVQPAPQPVAAAPAPVVVAPAPAPVVVVPAPAPVVVAKEIVSFDLLFDFDKSAIKDEMVPVLEQAKMILEEDSAVNFTVSGHTDSTGPEVYNQGLSERRAASVKNWLVSNGISAARLEAVGYGETQPKYDNATREGRKLNRRVELQSK
ncbi:MAG: outer membrane beta-barrel domain-containing protein [Desulfuromonadales bacterium]|nr:outer membrane beta-barrel domain-containing protein [Desulfuromonadales bacterium]